MPLQTNARFSHKSPEPMLPNGGSSGRKWELYCTSFLTVAFGAGLINGWPALRRQLISENQSSSALSEKSLGFIFTVGSWSNIAFRILFGLARDNFGTKRTVGVSIFFVTCGIFGLAWSDSDDVVSLAFSMAFVGLGSGIHMCVQPVAALYENNSGTVLSSLSGAYQISALVFPALATLRIGRPAAYGGFAIVIMLLGGFSVYALPLGSSFLMEETEEKPRKDDPVNNSGLSNSSAFKQMRSLEYIMLLLWFSICLTLYQYYIATIGFQLEAKGDASGHYTGLFSPIYASAAFFSPFGGSLADYFGIGATQALATVSFAFSMFILSSSWGGLNGQVIGMVIFALSTCQIFGMYNTNIGKRFGYANFGTLSGVGLLICGILGLFQCVLISWAVSGFETVIDFCCGVILLLLLPYCFWLRTQERNGTPKLSTKAVPSSEEEVPLLV